MIKRFVLLGLAALVAALFGATTQFSPGTTHADTSTLGWDVQFCDTFAPSPADTAATCASTTGTSTANNTNPTYVSHLALQTAGGAPAEPFFDLATAAWSPNLVTSPGGGLGTPLIGAIVGQIKFSLDSNLDVSLTGNIDPVSGAPHRCGDTSTLVIAPPAADTLAAAATPITNPTMTLAGFDFTKYVQSFDDDNNNLVEYTSGVDPSDGGDTLPQTQADTNGNGIPDGADRMPDFIPRLLNAAGIGSVFKSRGYAIASVAATNKIDVNFLGLDLTSLGGGYISITTIGVVDPASVYNPATAAQSQITCPPFISSTTTYGTSIDNPATGANEGGVAIRKLDNTKPGLANVTYAINVSTAEDYDLDGVPAGLDYCATDATTNADTEAASPGFTGDRLAGACDPHPASPDNCGAGECTTAATNCVTSGGVQVAGSGVAGFEGGAPATSYPWTLDQDVDCDGAANFADNCPNTPNGSAAVPPQPVTGAQRDSDADGVGDACDPKPPLGNARSGVPKPVTGALPDGWINNNNDHDVTCDDPITIGGGPEGFGTPTGTFNDATCFSHQDSSDDGVADWDPTAPDGSGGALGQGDFNSDSDFDGVSDGEEMNGDGICDGNPTNADTNGNGILDGAELSGGVPCWQVDVTKNATASLNPNKNGSPDSDGDGCSNFEEKASGRDALWPYDFTDAPGPATLTGTDGKLYFSPSATRSKSISLADASVAISYVGRTSSNAGAAYYNGDWNNDTIPDGLQLDRGAAGGGHLANPGNNAITLSDVSVILSQISLPGNNCVSPP